ncbi:VOC family protein [Methanolobus sp. ZRKC2]|uniref:VOC family protein n=1 Tax=Methanolobus sp. ZRKC2 TaxID=3125783 RepID=UPI003246EBBA
MKLEVDMVVDDAIAAADYYEKLFGAKILSKTDLEKNLNEASLMIAGTEIRLLNENKDYDLFSPTSGANSSIWMSLVVDDIETLYEKALQMEGKSIQPITEYREINVKNAVFSDKFNHTWVLNQVLV